MATKFEEYAGTRNTGAIIAGNQYWAQTFTPAEGHKITEVILPLSKADAVPSNVIINIYALNSDNHPTGSPLCTAIIDGDSLTPIYTFTATTCVFDINPTLNKDTEYAIVVKAVAASNGIQWGGIASGGYARGESYKSTNGGTSWGSAQSPDYFFEEWGTGSSSPADKIYSKQLVAIAFDAIWYESSAGTMTVISASDADVNTSAPLTMFEAYQKACIANTSNLKILDLANIKLTSTDLAGTCPHQGNILASANNTAQMVVDFAASIASSAAITVYGQLITNETFVDTAVVSCLNDNGNVVQFTLNANAVTAPHWYDWTPYGNDTDLFGIMPSWATLGCVYRGRAVLSGNKQYPHLWYMSRQGNIWDWQYAAIDTQSPVAGHNANVSKIGDVIKALIPLGDDYLMFGCASSMWLLEGDPVEGGTLDKIQAATGIFGAKSWCVDDNGNIYFVGLKGLYIAPPPYSAAKCISGGVLPNFVSEWELDPSLHRVVLGYDRINNGILVCRTLLSDGTNVNYFYSLDTEGFFPETYPEECGILTIFNYDSDDDSDRGLIAGCNDGYLRVFSNSAKDDDVGLSDEAIHSYCACPIQPLGEDAEREGRLNSLTVINAGGASGGTYDDTDTVEIQLFKGDNPELILEDMADGLTPFISVSMISAGRQPRVRTKLKGAYMGVLANNSALTETWAVERIIANIKGAGRVK